MSASERNELHNRVMGALQAASVNPEPFPHFYAENVFPDEVYAHIQEVLAEKDNYKRVEGKYVGRAFSNTHELAELNFMYSVPFFQDVLMLFAPLVKERWGGRNSQFRFELRLIRDEEGYKIGPHTDTTEKVVSLLFYLPPDDSKEQYGTCLYKPLPSFVPDDDPEHRRHYKFEDFEMLGTFPFKPNACLGFWRTDESWHGVPVIPEPIRRDVLLYNVYTAGEIVPPQGTHGNDGDAHEGAVSGDGPPEHEGLG